MLSVLTAFVFAVAPVMAQTVTETEKIVVTTGHMNGWDMMGSVTFSNEQKPPQLIGNGSAKLMVEGEEPGMDDGARLHTDKYDGMMLSDITALMYSIYIPTDEDKAPYLSMSIDTDGDATTVEDTLEFMPVGLTPGAWQEINAMLGQWTVNGELPTMTLAEYLVLEGNEDAKIISDGDVGGLSIVAGYMADMTGWENFMGYVDKVLINNDLYNFEPTVNTPPTNKDMCKEGMWQVYTNPMYKNQGACVSSMAKKTPTPAGLMQKVLNMFKNK